MMSVELRPGTVFRGIINYLMGKVENDQGEVLFTRFVDDQDKKKMIEDFSIGASVNRKIKLKTYHAVLTFADKEISSQKMSDVVKDYIDEMDKKFPGLAKTQYVVIRHNDTEHHHAHIVFSRVDDRGKTINLSHDYRKSMEICKELTLRHKLEITGERNWAKNNIHKHRGDRIKNTIKKEAHYAKKVSRGVKDFQNKMNQKGIQQKERQSVSLIGTKSQEAGLIPQRLSRKMIKGLVDLTGVVVNEATYEVKTAMMKVLKEEKNKKPQNDIKSILSASKAKSMSWEDFEKKVAEKGVKFDLTRNSNDNKVRGIVFEYQGVKIKGSDIGKEFSALNIERTFEKSKGLGMSR